MPVPRKVEVARVFTTTLFFPVQFVIQQVKKVRNIWQENRTLRTEVARLSIDNASLGERAIENKRLRQLLDFKEKTEFSLIPCEVIGRNPERSNYSFVVNAGKSEGVARNMPVVGIEGVVGKTISTSSFASQVQLLSDPNCRLGIMVQRSRVAGVLESEDGIRFRMQTQEYADIEVGDLVIASGLGGIFPKGLKVGKVRSMKMDEFNTFKKVYVDLHVDFDYVEEVFVMKKVSSWRPDTTLAILPEALP